MINLVIKHNNIESVLTEDDYIRIIIEFLEDRLQDTVHGLKFNELVNKVTPQLLAIHKDSDKKYSIQSIRFSMHDFYDALKIVNNDAINDFFNSTTNTNELMDKLMSVNKCTIQQHDYYISLLKIIKNIRNKEKSSERNIFSKSNMFLFIMLTCFLILAVSSIISPTIFQLTTSFLKINYGLALFGLTLTFSGLIMTSLFNINSNIAYEVFNDDNHESADKLDISIERSYETTENCDKPGGEKNNFCLIS